MSLAGDRERQLSEAIAVFATSVANGAIAIRHAAEALALAIAEEEIAATFDLAEFQSFGTVGRATIPVGETPPEHPDGTPFAAPASPCIPSDRPPAEWRYYGEGDLEYAERMAALKPAPIVAINFDQVCECGAGLERLSTWHPDPAGWTCRECAAFVPLSHVSASPAPDPPSSHAEAHNTQEEEAVQEEGGQPSDQTPPVAPADALDPF